jgi:hypothetical protein
MFGIPLLFLDDGIKAVAEQVSKEKGTEVTPAQIL